MTDVSKSSTKRTLFNTLDGAGASGPVKKPRVAKPKVTSTSIGNCSLSKKDFGDKIKACLALEKYAVQPMRFYVTMDCAFMRNFFGGSSTITPADFDESSPVVVAELNNTQAGVVFGVSKIKNGNRMETVHLSNMIVVFHPSTGKASCWVSV
ncbi:hypothetical protein BDZ94DRAFT_1247244 [Collybia nuda]|uniref:Uncharacterized protein n=1 Tax=Collybia nuda TaxID=64659 RepID=A0A9P5YDT3_9AGAR|nr:hypothetical protein BDZ94DRAFT_1247244 [Collybia nuda]